MLRTTLKTDQTRTRSIRLLRPGGMGWRGHRGLPLAELGRQPVETLVQAVALGSTCRLDVPLKTGDNLIRISLFKHPPLPADCADCASPACPSTQPRSWRWADLACWQRRARWRPEARLQIAKLKKLEFPLAKPNPTIWRGYTHHFAQLLTSLFNALPVVTVHHENQTLCVLNRNYFKNYPSKLAQVQNHILQITRCAHLEIVPPQWTNFILATNIPHSETDILVLNGLDIES